MSKKEMSVTGEMSPITQKAEQAPENEETSRSTVLDENAECGVEQGGDVQYTRESKDCGVVDAQVPTELSQKEVVETEVESFPLDNIPQVWQRVFELMDPSDRRNFMKSSPEWHSWTESQRTSVQFLEVVPILMESILDDKLLGCRELSQSYISVLDSLSQTNTYGLCFDFELDLEPAPGQINRFCSGEEIQKFLQDMESHPGNPFPGRHIVLELDIPRGQHNPLPEETQLQLCTQFWTNTILMLEKIGRYVRIATIDLKKSEIIGVEADEIFRKCLILLPHLQRLNVVDGINRGGTLDDVQNFYRANVLPTLPSLETVYMNMVTTALSHAVLRSCCVPQNVKRLFVVEWESQHLCEAVYRFHNLEVLKAYLFIEDFETLAMMLQPPPLREVDLRYYGSPDFQRVCASLELFSDTLVSVKVNSTSAVDIDLGIGSAEPHRINLPKLRSLVLQDYHGPLDLFLQLQSLTELEIYCYGVVPYQGSIVDYKGYERWMWKSNIWTLMPALDTFHIYIHGRYDRKFTRQEYVEFNTGDNGN